MPSEQDLASRKFQHDWQISALRGSPTARSLSEYPCRPSELERVPIPSVLPSRRQFEWRPQRSLGGRRRIASGSGTWTYAAPVSLLGSAGRVRPYLKEGKGLIPAKWVLTFLLPRRHPSTQAGRTLVFVGCQLHEQPSVGFAIDGGVIGNVGEFE